MSMPSNTLIAVREGDLEALIATVQELNTKVNSLTSDVERPIDLKAAAIHLSCSSRHIYKLINEDPDFPVHKTGVGKLSFYRVELNDWLKTR